MKNRLHYALRTLHSAFGPETLASFGEARLVKQLDGKIELIGGAREERRAAREWCSLFLHEAAVASSACICPCRLRHLPASSGKAMPRISDKSRFNSGFLLIA